jgi:hypothetical protein
VGDTESRSRALASTKTEGANLACTTWRRRPQPSLSWRLTRSSESCDDKQ